MPRQTVLIDQHAETGECVYLRRNNGEVSIVSHEIRDTSALETNWVERPMLTTDGENLVKALKELGYGR